MFQVGDRVEVLGGIEVDVLEKLDDGDYKVRTSNGSIYLPNLDDLDIWCTKLVQSPKKTEEIKWI